MNNPLKYIDPSGHWPNFGDIFQSIKDAINTVVTTVQNVASTVKAEVTSIASNVKAEVTAAAQQVQQTVQTTVTNVVQQTTDHILDAVGIETVSSVDTSLVNNMPVVEITPGGLIDDILFFKDSTVTLYPVAVFTNKAPMSKYTKEEEGYHWNDIKTSGDTAGWYKEYIAEYSIYFALSVGDANYAHNAVSKEQTAMEYAATQTKVGYQAPPSIVEYWMDIWQQIASAQ